MIYQFAEFEIDQDKFELRRNGIAQHIEPLVFDLLTLLVKNPHKIITRDELIEKLWDGRIISEATISTSIKSARKAIGDNGEEQKYIRTIRGRGISFVADVKSASEDKSASLQNDNERKIPSKMIFFGVIAMAIIAGILYLSAGNSIMDNDPSDQITAKAPAAPYKVAVMPFADMSQNGDQEYFADGMAEEILNLLARVPGLDVTSRTTAFSLKGQNLTVPEIAQRLGVNYIVEGSVRTTNDRIRVTAQLIDVAGDQHLWSQTFDRNLTSIFDVQDDISLAVADALKIEIGANLGTREAPTTNITAYELYLKGHQLFLNRGTFGANDRVGYLEEAIANLEQATALDPDFAEAWADLAGVSMVIPTFDGVNYSFDGMANRSEIFIERALTLDENVSQAWASKGFMHLVRLEFGMAEDALIRATELNPLNETAWLWLGLTYTTVGASEKAINAIKIAIDLAPIVSVNYNVIGAATHAKGDPAKAAEYQNIAVNERGFELGRIDTLLIALDPAYKDTRGTRAAAVEDATRYIDFLEKNSDPERDKKLTLYVDAHLNPNLRSEAQRALDSDIGSRQKSAFLGAYLLGDGDRIAKHFKLGTENDGLNLRRIFSPVGRPLFKSKDFRDYLISLNMLCYWKNNQFPVGCYPVGENDFMCE